MGQGLEITMDRLGPGDHDDVPAGVESVFVQPVDFPDAAAHPIADHGMPQLFADGDAHPIGGRPVGSGVKHKASVCLTLGAVKPLKDVIEF